MKFIDYLVEQNDTPQLLTVEFLKANVLSREVEMQVYIKDNCIYIKDDQKLAVKDYHNYNYPEVLQLLKDFITKNYMAEFDLAERIPLLSYTISHDKETDLYLRRTSRIYQHKPLICAVSDIDEHNYIIGYHANNIDKAAEYIGLPKEGYTLYILDGKFEASKTVLDNGITAYVIAPHYHIRKADGNTEVTIAGQQLDIKHIRRQI